MLHFFWSGYVLSEKSFEIYEFSNLEIPKWAQYYLSQKTDFHQSHWGAGRVTRNPSDILIGHPPIDTRPDPQRILFKEHLSDWVRDNALDPAQPCHPNTYILMPWIPRFPKEWLQYMYGDRYKHHLRVARKIFALCGPIWIDKTWQANDDSIQYEVRHKLIQCNMGVAAHNLAITKKSFNPAGQRQILHMSHLQAYKGFDITCKSLIGTDALLNVAGAAKLPVGLVEYKLDQQTYVFNFLGYVNNNDPEFNHWVAETCDFYIHTGRMDAQATTILENAARGLIPLVTPESGFSSPHAIYLSHDPDANRQIIQAALQMPEEELMQRSRFLREQILRDHNWEGIYNRIWDGIMADLEEQKSEQQYQSSERNIVDLAGSSSTTFLPPTEPQTTEPQAIRSHDQSQPATSSRASDIPRKVDQNLYISRQALLQFENQIRLHRHIERYALLRQFARGVVCDAACGCGYGSYLLATNPDVEYVIGVDVDPKVIEYAKREYRSNRTEFHLENLRTWDSSRQIDMLISVETIEHIKDQSILPDFVNRNRINQVILTYPSKKTTHYNPYHHYDYRLQDVLDLFDQFICYRHFNWEYEFDVAFLVRDPKSIAKA